MNHMRHQRDSRHIISKQRVRDFGEVFTPKPVVRSMLDLVIQEVERTDSTFLDPACGTGNFLIETLIRRLRVISREVRGDQVAYERQALQALSSLYGIEIQQDNITDCRGRLLRLFRRTFSRLFKNTCVAGASELAECIVINNIVWGDFLTGMTMGDDPQPITFVRWCIK